MVEGRLCIDWLKSAPNLILIRLVGVGLKLSGWLKEEEKEMWVIEEGRFSVVVTSTSFWGW